MTDPSETESARLSTTSAQRQALALAALQLLEQSLARTDIGLADAVPPVGLLQQLLQPPPETGRPEDELMALLQTAAEAGRNKRHPGDLAYIPSAGLYSGAIAALLAAGLHAHTATAQESPALVALEEGMLRWLAAVVGLPPCAEGLLLSGGSLANQTAIVCAREQAGGDASAGIAYLSTQAHHSLAKALHLSGIAPQAVRWVATDGEGRMDLAALQRQMQADQQAGLRPWLLVGTAGSTDTGAIDDLSGMVHIARQHGLWLHVDAAYGGLFALTARGARRLQGLGEADSVTVDAHKGLMLPYGAAAVLLREPGRLAQAHRGRGPYLRDVAPLDGLPNYFERGPEQTRPFRGLLLWLPLHWHGVAAFRQALDQALDLAEAAALRLRHWPECELILQPALSIVAFRARAGEATTARWLAALNGSGSLQVSSTLLDGELAIRLAFLQPGSGPAQLDAVMACLQAAGSVRQPGQ